MVLGALVVRQDGSESFVHQIIGADSISLLASLLAGEA
jgi:hypothetical protein